MKKVLLSIFLFSLIYLVASPTVSANGSCQPIYGGGQTCTSGNLFLKKYILYPGTQNDYRDDMGINDARFNPNDQVTFKLVITNNGTATIDKINAQDLFPQFVNFKSGAGSFDSNSKTLSFEIDNLNPGATQTIYITGQIVPNGNLPQDKGVVCVTNQAKASTSEGQNFTDNAGFCIQIPQTTKGGLPVMPPPPVKTTPATGPEMLPLLGMFPTALIGLFLRKKSKNMGGSK